MELEVYREDHLLDCFSNRAQLWDAVKTPAQMFKGPGGQSLAAKLIQKRWKGYRAYSNFRQLKYLMKMAAVIQRRYRLHLLKSKTSVRLREIRQDRIDEWNKMQDEFKSNWPHIKEKRRIEVHINSFSISEVQRMTIEKYKQKENAQIARLFSVKDPLVNVIYICPFPLTSEIYNYYLKILELVEIEHPEKRFTIVVPENYTKFHEHLSLTQALLYSPLALG